MWNAIAAVFGAVALLGFALGFGWAMFPLVVAALAVIGPRMRSL